ncbi:MAG: pilus assembly FimT family protein [Planctomycetota bacterium]
MEADFVTSGTHLLLRRPSRRRGFTLIEILVVVSILIILMTLVIGTVLDALSAMNAEGGASGVASFLRDAQVQAVRSGKVLGVRADQITPTNGNPVYWELTAWQYPTEADAYLAGTRGASNDTTKWPQNALPVATFDLDPRDDLQICDTSGTYFPADTLSLASILILPDGSANRDTYFSVVDRNQVKEGNPQSTAVELQHATGRVFVVKNSDYLNP